MEQKTFLRSLIKQIEVNPKQGVVDSTIPLEKQGERLMRKVLPLRQVDSTRKSQDKTFRAIFVFPDTKEEKKAKEKKPKRIYRNPIFLAQEYKKDMENEDLSPSKLAHKLGISLVHA